MPMSNAFTNVILKPHCHVAYPLFCRVQQYAEIDTYLFHCCCSVRFNNCEVRCYCS